MAEFWDNLTQIFYFTSLEEVGYYFAILGLMLALIQFGLPFAQPFVANRYSKRQREQVSAMLNKILGFSAFASLFLLPLVVAIFIAKALSSLAIVIGIGWANNIWFFVVLTILLSIGLYFTMRWWWHKYIISDKYEVPQTDTQMLKNEVHNLSEKINNLTSEVHSLTEQLRRYKQ